MRHLRLFLALGTSIAVGGAAFLVACGTSSPAQPADAGAGDAQAQDEVDPVDDSPVIPDDDATMVVCKLDNGSDPVGLCVQKAVLRGLHQRAFTTGGVAASWNSISFAVDTDAGAVIHDLHDDTAYGQAIGLYHTSSGRYGDNEYTDVFDADLVKLVPILESELKTLPNEYGGELYAQLRNTSAGLRFIDHNPEADAIDVIAEAYGRAIYTSHFFPSGGAGDGGPADGILATDGTTLEYAPADVVTGSLALMDMAVRHATDDPKSSGAWQIAAQRSIDHVYVHARDPATKMYYRSLRLVAGGTDAGVLDDISHAPAPADLFSSDVGATIALALVRAQDLVLKNGAPLAMVSFYPFEPHAEEAIASLNGTPSLWDATGFGYMDGYVPSTTTLLTNKPTRANALLFAAIHRANLVGSTMYATQLIPMRTLFLNAGPGNTTFFSLDVSQSGYFAEVSKGFDFTDNGDGGTDPRAKSYFSSATTAAVEGLTEQFFGQ